MARTGPLVCKPSQKARLEAKNGVAQLDYISYLVNKLRVHAIRESHVMELQKHAVKGIYPCAGNYRKAGDQVSIGQSLHRVPEAALVPGLVREMVDRLNSTHATQTAIERAAYAMWRVNWIHPFMGGNGRTARAISYLVLCIDMRGVLPGRPSVPTIIYRERKAYVDALKSADASVNEDPAAEPDLRDAIRLVNNAGIEQLTAARRALEKSRRK